MQTHAPNTTQPRRHIGMTHAPPCLGPIHAVPLRGDQAHQGARSVRKSVCGGEEENVVRGEAAAR